jgi:hypothetical protein
MMRPDAEEQLAAVQGSGRQHAAIAIAIWAADGWPAAGPPAGPRGLGAALVTAIVWASSGRVGGGAMVEMLVAAVMSSAPSWVPHGIDLSVTAVGRCLLTMGAARPST